MSQKNQQMAELEAQNHDLIKLEQEFAEKFSQKQLEIDTISRRLQDTESFLKRIQDEKAEWETRRELLQTEMKTASHLIEEQNRMHQKVQYGIISCYKTYMIDVILILLDGTKN
jgi:chromosome segregation ATPase